LRGFGLEAVCLEPAHTLPQRVTLEPSRRYVAHGAHMFEPLLGQGWWDVEDWGVWSSDRVATIMVRVDPELRDSHVLRLYGQCFVNPEHPQILIKAFINSALAVRRVFTETDNENLEIGLQAIDSDGTAEVQLIIDSPASVLACGLPANDVRELGFGLEAVCLEPMG
jgi:hypothetical protein